MSVPIRRHRRDDHAPDRDAHDATTRTAVGTRWDPIGDLERLHDQLATYLDSWRRLPNLLDDAFTPLADIEETDDAYHVEIELPGVRRDDVEIEVAGRRVSVRGERKEKERAGVLRRRERVVGRFSYEVVLPGDVDDDAVEAHLDDGVLTIRLAKPEEDRPRRIPVG